MLATSRGREAVRVSPRYLAEEKSPGNRAPGTHLRFVTLIQRFSYVRIRIRATAIADDEQAPSTRDPAICGDCARLGSLNLPPDTRDPLANGADSMCWREIRENYR